MALAAVRRPLEALRHVPQGRTGWRGVCDEVDESGRQAAGVQLIKLHQLDEVVEARLAAVQREVTYGRRLTGVLHLKEGRTGSGG